MEYIGWVATVIAMIGVVLNARGSIVCFYVWLLSNGYYTVVNVLSGSYSQAALFAFNLIMAVYGIYCWKRKENKNSGNDAVVAPHPSDPSLGW